MKKIYYNIHIQLILQILHIYNEVNNTKIKDITILGLTEISPVETDIGKKILYCQDCNLHIMNDLKEIYKE